MVVRIWTNETVIILASWNMFKPSLVIWHIVHYNSMYLEGCGVILSKCFHFCFLSNNYTILGVPNEDRFLAKLGFPKWKKSKGDQVWSRWVLAYRSSCNTELKSEYENLSKTTWNDDRNQKDRKCLNRNYNVQELRKKEKGFS